MPVARLLSLCFVCTANVALAQSLTVGSEVLLTEVAEGPIEGGFVAATPGSQQVLVTWTDYGPFGPGATSGDVRGRLINDDGTTIDMEIAVGPVLQVGGSSAFDGTRYLVTWSEGWTNSHPDRFMAAFVSAAGVVSPSFALASNPPVPLTLLPRVAYGSGVFFIAHGSFDDDNHMADGLIVDASGRVTRTPRLATLAWLPRVASDGTGFLMTWNELSSGLTAYRMFDATGQPTSDIHRPHYDTEANWVSDGNPSVTFAGDHYVLGWNGSVFRGTQWSTNTIYAMRVDTDGELLDPRAVSLASVGYVINVETFAIGEDAALLWIDCCSMGPRPLYGGRLSRMGVPMDPGGLVLSEETPIDSVFTGIAQGGGVQLFYRAAAAPGAWISRTLWQRPASAALEPGTARWLNPAPVPQSVPQYVPGDPVGVVAFADLRSGDGRLYVGRVDESGAPLDGTGGLLSASPHQQGEVSMDGVPSAALAVWPESTGNTYQYMLRAAWISATDSSLTITPFDLVSESSAIVVHPRVLFDGNKYFVTWIDGHGGSQQLVAVLLSAMDATPNPTTHTLTSSSGVTLWAPEPVQLADGFAIAYRDNTSGGPDLFVLRTDADLTPLPEEPLLIAPSTVYAGDQLALANGELWVTYSDTIGQHLAHVSQSSFTVTSTETLVNGSTAYAQIVPAPDGSLLAIWRTSWDGPSFASQRCPNATGPLDGPSGAGTGLATVALPQDLGGRLVPTTTGARVAYGSVATGVTRAAVRSIFAGACTSCCIGSDGGDSADASVPLDGGLASDAGPCNCADAGAPLARDGGASDSGCGCRAAGGRSDGLALTFIVLVAAAFARRRRTHVGGAPYSRPNTDASRTVRHTVRRNALIAPTLTERRADCRNPGRCLGRAD